MQDMCHPSPEPEVSSDRHGAGQQAGADGLTVTQEIRKSVVGTVSTYPEAISLSCSLQTLVVLAPEGESGLD